MLRQSISSPTAHKGGRLLASLVLEEGSCIARAYRGTSSSSLSYRLARCQSSLCSTKSRPFTQSKQPQASKQQQQQQQQRQVVNPSLRARRPQVNGQAVAFHVRDLLPTTPASNGFHPSLATSVNGADSSRHNNNNSNDIKKEYESDLIVVLDMDECILHSQFLSNPNMAQVLAHQVAQSRRRNEAETGEKENQPVDHFRVQLPDGGDTVHVNLRPGLEEFLTEITNRYETHIFTAAMPIYARPVLDHLERNGTVNFAARWYREHCTWDGLRNAYVKNLSVLPLRDLKRTVLIDNNPLSFLSHPSNGILVSSFYNDPQDTTLSAVQSLLLELEAHPGDVRPVLEHRFGLKQALEELGH